LDVGSTELKLAGYRRSNIVLAASYILLVWRRQPFSLCVAKEKHAHKIIKGKKSASPD